MGIIVYTRMCPKCHGSGEMECPSCHGEGYDYFDGGQCGRCDGTGEITCDRCGGSGDIEVDD